MATNIVVMLCDAYIHVCACAWILIVVEPYIFQMCPLVLFTIVPGSFFVFVRTRAIGWTAGVRNLSVCLKVDPCGSRQSATA